MAEETTAFPMRRDALLAERLAHAPAGAFVRTWTLRDDNHQHMHGTVRISESPLHFRLYWRPDVHGAVEEIGLFRLHLGALLAARYIRPEPEHGPGDALRLRFHRGDDGQVGIRVRGDTPALVVGTVGQVPR